MCCRLTQGTADEAGDEHEVGDVFGLGEWDHEAAGIDFGAQARRESM